MSRIKILARIQALLFTLIQGFEDVLTIYLMGFLWIAILSV